MLLSYSSMCTYLSCPRKYYLYKVKKVKRDDGVRDTTALRLGTAFHKVLEDTLHEKPELKTLLKLVSKAVQENELDGINKWRLHAMLHKYYMMHQKSKLRCLHSEIEISTDKFLGYVDAILVDSFGNWWICDLKTAAGVRDQLLNRLHKDAQLNLYAAHVDFISEKYNLPKDKFAGCRYRVVQKTKAEPQGNETLARFVGRVATKSYDIVVTKENLDVKDATELFDFVHESITNSVDHLKEGHNFFNKNRGACLQYNAPCDYWSQCHGANHDECKSKFVKVYDHNTMIDATIPQQIEELF